MASPYQIIPRLEGMLATMPETTLATQRVSLFVELCKAVMRSPGLRDQTDWAFTGIPDIDETSAASATAPETGAVLYAVLYEQQSADASVDYVAICDDADGTIAAFAHSDSRFTDAPVLQMRLPATATDLTGEFHGAVFPQGLPFAAYMSFTAEGEDGTNPATDDIRAWALYRTGTALVN